VGPARSGTTALITALGEASNVRTFSEPLPRIGLEVRRWRLGAAVEPRAVIWASRIGRMREVLAKGRIYGEKDQQVYCWLPFYHALFGSRFVLCHRDGRESVPSLWDLHYKVHGNLYREADDAERLSAPAAERAARLPPVEQDEVDAMRARPTADEPGFACWASMSRFEMIAWYWADYMRVAQRDLYKLPDAAWRSVRFRGGEAMGLVGELFEFLDLEGFDPATIGPVLDARPGSFASQGAEAQERHPAWEEWDADTTARFDRHAASTMVQFGYYGIERLPAVGGADADPQAPVHVPADDVQERVWNVLRGHPSLGRMAAGTVLAVGPNGNGAPSSNVRRWHAEPLTRLPANPVDVVVALGVVEHAPDMDRLVIELARRARHALIVSGSHGHFTNLVEHRYATGTGDPPVNQWCIAKSRSLLSNSLGFASVRSFGVPSGEYLRPVIGALVATRNMTA